MVRGARSETVAHYGFARSALGGLPQNPAFASAWDYLPATRDKG